MQQLYRTILGWVWWRSSPCPPSRRAVRHCRRGNGTFTDSHYLRCYRTSLCVERTSCALRCNASHEGSGLRCRLLLTVASPPLLSNVLHDLSQQGLGKEELSDEEGTTIADSAEGGRTVEGANEEGGGRGVALDRGEGQWRRPQWRRKEQGEHALRAARATCHHLVTCRVLWLVVGGGQVDDCWEVS